MADTLGNDVGDTACFAAAALLLSVMAAWVLRALLRLEHRKHARAAFAAARRAVSEWRGARVEDEVGRIVQSKVEEQTVEQFRSTWAVGAFIGAVFVGFVVTNIAMGKERFMTVPQQVVCLYLQSVFTIVLVFPDLVTWRTIDVFYVSIALGFATVMAPFFSTSQNLMMNLIISDFGTSILVMSRRSPMVTIPTSMMYAVSTSMTIWRHGGLCAGRPLNFAIGHAALVVFVTFAGLLLEIAIRTLLRQATEMQSTKELLGAASALLRTVCDVVVELDASGTIVGSAHDLGTFLLRGRDFALQKHRLADLFSNDEDKRMFERRLCAERPPGMELAEAVHVHMKDSDRNTLKVEILSFQYKHFDSQPRFMVGLRDFADATVSGSRSQRSHSGARESATPACSVLGAPQSDPSSDQESSEASASGHTSEAQNDPMRAVVTVDTTTERLEVRGISAGFQMRVGRLALRTCFLDLIEPGKEEDFRKWVVAANRYGSLWPNASVNLHLRQRRIRATLGVLQESEDDPLDPERLELLVMDIRPVTRGGSGGGRAAKPYTDFRGTPREKTTHTAL